MRKRLLKIVITLIVIALLFPVANLILGPGNEGTLAGLKPGDAEFAAAAAVLEKSCAACHTSEGEMPFYAGFPLARGLVERDIEEALRHLNFTAALAGKDVPVDQVPLAKIEHSVARATMPPHRYRMLHWDSGLSGEERKKVLGWIGRERSVHHATDGVLSEMRAEVVQPLPPPPELDAAMAALGKKLFHETRLSGDDTVSCATCHALDKGGCDQLRFSRGIGGAEGDINAPTVFNATFQIRQFWDGRAADLKEQAGGPVTNPIEMGANWPDVIAKLEKDTEYVEAFDALFGGRITSGNIQEAIAAFEQSLVTTGSRFDRYMTGESGALTAHEIEGYELFKENACATCHVGAVLGGRSFELMGRREDYFADRGGVIKPDHGRFNFTGKEEDRHKFKVPTLRNVAVTFPYFHDGVTSDLKEAVRMMAVYNSGENLSEGELDRIVAFLNALTGEYEGDLLQ